ncbi:MAG: hypothetical protein NTZ37_04220 [Methanoregula sp.]|nr:hypothetical protein [Methanoregula sp.]
MTHPFARRPAAELAARPAPHILLRGMFVAVDRTLVERSVTRSHPTSR